MISSNHHRGEEETINRTIPHKKPFRSTALIDRKKSVGSFLHNSWTILGTILGTMGEIKVEKMNDSGAPSPINSR